MENKDNEKDLFVDGQDEEDIKFPEFPNNDKSQDTSEFNGIIFPDLPRVEEESDDDAVTFPHFEQPKESGAVTRNDEPSIAIAPFMKSSEPIQEERTETSKESAEENIEKTMVVPVQDHRVDRDIEKTTVYTAMPEEPIRQSMAPEEPKVQKPVQEKPSVKQSAPKKATVKKTAEAPKPKKKKKTGKIILRAILAIFAICVLLFTLYIRQNLQGVPELDISKFGVYSQASEIYDTNGNLLMELGSNENIDWANYEDVPENLVNAFISVEDKRFYNHKGVDIKRTAGAVWGQLTHTSSYGGSTITQQLVKNTFLTQEVSYKRKIQEIYLSLQLEKKMEKNEILEWYMNTVYFGGPNYGIANAAKDYFGKDLNELTLRECACLAGLVQSPNYYNPRENFKKGDMSPTDTRTNTVLYAMHENGKISDEEYQAALNDHLVIAPTGRTSSHSEVYYKNAYFIDYAMTEIATDMLKAENNVVNDETLAQKKNQFHNAGYKFYLTIDPTIQEIVQTKASEFDNYPNPKNEDTIAQFSAVVMDQHTGQIKAIVGGREEQTDAEGYNRATDSKQAVGSSIKPLSVYAPAIETGDFPGTVVDDEQYSIPGYGPANTWPSGEFTDGPITMRRALELSHNIPAARFLLEHVGIDRAVDFMVGEGFDPANIQHTASGIALGATDVTTLEMTGAYATLANGGVYIEPHTYTRVENKAGEVLLDDTRLETHRVFSEETAWLVTDMMQTNMTEGLGINARLYSVDSCGKTGTHEHKVISFGGYTGYYTSFLRISTDNYTDFTNSSSYYQSARLWRNYMEPIHEGLENKSLQEKMMRDLDIRQVYVCGETGLLATDVCEAAGMAHTEYATSESAPTETCESTHSESNMYGYIDPETGLWVDKGWWSEDGTFHPFE